MNTLLNPTDQMKNLSTSQMAKEQTKDVPIKVENIF